MLTTPILIGSAARLSGASIAPAATQATAYIDNKLGRHTLSSSRSRLPRIQDSRPANPVSKSRIEAESCRKYEEGRVGCREKTKTRSSSVSADSTPGGT